MVPTIPRVERSPLRFPPVDTAYLVSDIQAFLTAADARTAELQAAIAEARAQLETLELADRAHREARDGVAARWLAAQAEAEATRAAATAEASAILEAAEAEARALLARAALRHRDDHEPAGAGR